MLYSAAQLTYLEHLGIDVWVPKDVPVAAAQAPLSHTQPVDVEQVPVTQTHTQTLDVPAHFEDIPVSSEPAYAEPVVNNPAPLTQTPANPIPATAPVTTSGAALNSALTSSIPAPAFPKAKDANAETQSHSKLEFNIQFWCYSSGVWIISGDVNVTPEQHKLAHNLAHFIQGKKRRPRHVNVFSWPMIDSPNVDQGESVALKYLQGHIERLQEVCPLKTVLLFNDCQFWPEQLPHVKLDMSLRNLLEDPSLKAKLWQTLRAHQHQD